MLYSTVEATVIGVNGCHADRILVISIFSTNMQFTYFFRLTFLREGCIIALLKLVKVQQMTLRIEQNNMVGKIAYQLAWNSVLGATEDEFWGEIYLRTTDDFLTLFATKLFNTHRAAEEWVKNELDLPLSLIILKYSK